MASPPASVATLSGHVDAAVSAAQTESGRAGMTLHEAMSYFRQQGKTQVAEGMRGLLRELAEAANRESAGRAAPKSN